MKKTMLAAHIALLAALAACSGPALQAERMRSSQDVVQDAPKGHPAAGATHMLPIWEDPEFIKG